MGAATPPAGLLGRSLARLARLAVLLVVVASTVFLLTATLPGDAAASLAGADRAAAAQIRTELGLDRPVLLRLLDWWGHALGGDLGRSWLSRTPVTEILPGRLAASAAVAIPAWGLALGAGWGTAVWLALRRRRPEERAATGLLAVLAGIPEAVVVVLLTLLLAGWAGWLPAVSLLPPGASPLARPELLVLPVLGLAVPGYAWAARLLRGPADEALGRRVVTAARRRGESTPRVVARHVLPPMLPSVAQAGAVLAAGVLGGGAVVETLLAYPGLGLLLTQAVAARDVPVVQGVSLVLAALALAGYAAADTVREVRR